MGNGIPAKNVSYTAEGMKIVSLDGASDILIRSFEVNGKSDVINSYDPYVGLVIYSYDKKSSWVVNGRYCQSGFIIIKKIKNISGASLKYWKSAHAKLYKWYFGVEPDYTKLVAGGFAYSTHNEDVKNSDGEVINTVRKRGLVYRSSTFNSFDNINNNDDFKGSKYYKHHDQFHDTNRAMSIIEQHWVEKAFDSWKYNGYQPKKVYCNAATWKYRKNNSWVNYNYYDSIAIEKAYEIYQKKYDESDDRTEFKKKTYCISKYMNNTKYYIYFNAPHIDKDMFGYSSSDGYQKNDYGCTRAIYRSSNAYTGNSTCVIL